MAAAYLKIWVGIGKERAVRERLRAMPGVLRADMTTGGQDVIALVDAPDHQALVDLVLEGARGIEGVERTETNLVLE